MEKIYLLLRNNQQTGPHSLQELMELQLKPKDLVWVEGKSYGWSYPSEIESLKPFVKGTPQAETPQPAARQPLEPAKDFVSTPSSNKKIYVSMPGGNAPMQAPPVSADPIEQKAEALRQRIQSYTPPVGSEPDEVRTNYSRKLEDVEEDYTSWVFQKKRKKKILAGISPMAIGIAMVITITGAWWLLKPSSSTPDQPPMVSKATPREEPVKEVIEPATDNTVASIQSNMGAVEIKNTAAVKKTAVKKHTAITGPATASLPVASTTTKPVNEVPVAEKTAIPDPVRDKAGADVTSTQQQPKEKRTIRGLLNVLFKKNKKEQEAEDARAANTTNEGRSATRRDDEQGATTIDLSDEVQVRSNQSPADWMMGVQGLKLTLYNKSAARLKNATVEVSYFSEQNDLLQKKTLQFSNIAAQKSQTLPAPDHRLADHVTYNVISATGESSAYAKQ